MSRLTDPRLVKIRAGSRGSGWAIGSCGVLTARHVVEPFLDGRAADGTAVGWCAAYPDPAPGAPGFDCDVIWQDRGLDLAVLCVRDGSRPAWLAAMADAKPAVLAEPGSDAVPGQAVGYPALALEDAQPAPDVVPGSLQPARGAVGGRMIFDVSASVPDDSALWAGMSGAAVRDAHDRLLGVVVSVDKKNQQRRFYVTALPDPAVDARFRQALTAVGAPAVLEASAAPGNRDLLALLDPAGRPYPIAEVPDLGDFGIRRSRTDVDTHGDPYYPYIRRDLDAVLRDALDRRASGTERRMLLLIGDAMAGKSRTLAEALRGHPGTAVRPLVIPHRDADLRQVVHLAAGCGGVVWLDDVNAYTTGLDAAIRSLADTPGVIVAATLRTDQLRRLQDNPDLRTTWDALSAAWLVEQITVEPGWSDVEQARLDGTESVIREAVLRGRPLGEVLGAADELRKRLQLGSPRERALVFTVADWPRAGRPGYLAEDLARRLWAAHLPPSAAADLADLADEDGERAFLDARAWACQKVADAAALVRRTRHGLVAEDYVVALRTTGNSVIPAEIWRQSVDTALAADSPAELNAVGYQAAMSRQYDIARQALAPTAYGDSPNASTAANALALVLRQQGNVAGALAAFRHAAGLGDPDVAPMAEYFIGDLLKQQGDVPGARAAYQRAIDSGHPVAATRALLGLGQLRQEQGDPAGARAAVQLVIDGGDPDAAARAENSLGDLLKEQGDPRGAQAAYQRAIDSGRPDQAAMGIVNLGQLRQEEGDADGAQAAYQRAIGSGDPEAAGLARLYLGELRQKQGDSDGAEAIYQQAIDSGDPVAVPRASISLGQLLEDRGDADGARAAYQQAIDFGDPDTAPRAANKLGELLTQRGDLRGAQAAYQRAIDSGHPEQAAGAALGLGRLLQEHGDTDGAQAAYQRAIDTGQPDAAPAAALALGMLLTEHGAVDAAKAAFQRAIDLGPGRLANVVPTALANLGALLAEQGDTDGARDAYQRVIDSGDQLAPTAACALGDLLAKHGDTDGASAAYRRAIDSGDPRWSSTAALSLGQLLQDHGDTDGAQAAYQQAIDSGDPDRGPKAMINLGLLLAGTGQLARARAVYQLAIDSGHHDWAPAAAVGIGDMLAEHGDTGGARAAYQQAIDSGHPDLAPMAMLNLAALLASQGNLEAARAAYQEAIDSAHPVQAPRAMFQLGVMLAVTQEPPDQDAAYRCYLQAANAGSVEAMITLAPVLALGGDAGGARALLQQAARAGAGQADDYAAVLDDDPAGGEPARGRLRKLADGGDTDALNVLGVLAWRGGVRDEAAALWTRSREAGDGAAPLLLHLCRHA
jgi:predicted negative regulator of RcsB-dependent stress response